MGRPRTRVMGRTPIPRSAAFAAIVPEAAARVRQHLCRTRCPRWSGLQIAGTNFRRLAAVVRLPANAPDRGLRVVPVPATARGLAPQSPRDLPGWSKVAGQSVAPAPARSDVRARSVCRSSLISCSGARFRRATRPRAGGSLPFGFSGGGEFLFPGIRRHRIIQGRDASATGARRPGRSQFLPGALHALAARFAHAFGVIFHDQRRKSFLIWPVFF